MRTGGTPNEWKIAPLAASGVPVFAAPDVDKVRVGNPALEAMPNGRLVAAVDLLGPGVKHVSGPKGKLAHLNFWLQGKIFTSGDKGQTWNFRQDFPFSNPILFRDGPILYLLGHCGNLRIMRSADGGETWSAPAALAPSEDDAYTLPPANVLHANGSIYLVLMRITDFGIKGEPAPALAAVVLRAREGANLLERKSWTWACTTTPFRDLFPAALLEGFGVPFFTIPERVHGQNAGGGRWVFRPGWDSVHVLQIRDGNHYWYDPTGKALHLLARAYVHRGNVAVFARLEENQAGALQVRLENAPAGSRMPLLPLPGGNLRFHIVYDEPSALFWLASNQVTDSMCRAERLPRDRHGLPWDESHRLQLHYSRNLVDWSFAGLIDAGANPAEMRSAPRLAIQGNDLYCVCSSGRADGRSPYETGVVTLHAVPAFRELVC